MNHAERGAVLGGLGGAALGAMAGSGRGHADKGALIGAGLGAVAGAVVGNQADRGEAEAEAAHQAVLAQAIGIEDIVRMSQAGVDENLIVGQIQSQGIAAKPTTEQIIWMKDQGVSSRVILAFQSAPPVTGMVAVPLEPPPSQTIVETVVVAPPPLPPPGIIITGHIGGGGHRRPHCR